MTLRKELLLLFFFFCFQAILAQSPRRAMEIIAHRGGVEKFPEQTIAAFEHAAAHKVDYIECDVRLTADSQIVLIHDETYGRTTNVKKIYGADKKIFELTFAEAMDLWINGGDGFKDEHTNLFRIPTLDEFLVVAKKYNVGVNIEVKVLHSKTRSLILESLNRNNFDLNKVVLNNFDGSISPPPWKMGTQTGITIVPKPTVDSIGVLIGEGIYYTISDTTLVINPLNVSFFLHFKNGNVFSEELIKLVSRYNLDKYYFLLRIASDSTLLVQYRMENGSYSSKKTNYKFNGGDLQGKISFTNDTLFVSINDSTSFVFANSSFIYEAKEPRFIIGTQYLPYPFRLKYFLIKNNHTDSLVFDISKNINISTYRTKLVPYNFNIQPMNYLGIPYYNYSKELTSYYHDLGYRTYIWTVNNKDLFIELLKDKNVYGVFTDYPLLFDTILNIQDNSEEIGSIPEDAELKNTYPNPFNGQCKIVVNIKKPNTYKIKITDLLGRDINTVADQFFSSNQFVFEWNGKDLNNKIVSSGTYFVVLQSDKYQAAAKILFLR